MYGEGIIIILEINGGLKKLICLILLDGSWKKVGLEFIEVFVY